MERREADRAARAARERGWDVEAEYSLEQWWLRGRAADGQRPVYAAKPSELAVLTVGGAVARLGESGARGPAYRVRFEDRTANGGAFVVFVYRGSSCVGVGASREKRWKAWRWAHAEVRHRRLLGQFESGREG